MDLHSVSHELKRRRAQAGLTLAELARRADTSPATLSRYENGWARFEIYTLRKLASALGCRLVVRLAPVRRAVRKPHAAEVVRRLRRLFWEHDLRSEDLDSYVGWILRRVLEHGSLEDVWLLRDFMGREAFLQAVQGVRLESAKASEFWRVMLEKEGLPCTRRLFPREAWSF